MPTTLVLLRHAKSAYPRGVGDHERPLSGRGRRDAPVAGRLIAQHVPWIATALVSTAVRTQQTWDLAAPALQVDDKRDMPELYLASADAMLARLRDETGPSVIVVAHNPGTEVLAERLTRNTSSPDYRQMVAKFPTAAFAVLTSDEPWAHWGLGSARLEAFVVARG